MWRNSSNIFAQLDVNEINEIGARTAGNIAQSWDIQWKNTLQNNTNETIYGALTNLGIFFAVGTLLFFMIQWLRDVLEGEYSRPISALIWPFIVMLLLANQGTMLSDFTLGMRYYLFVSNKGIIQIVVNESNIKQYQQALNVSIAEEVAGSYLRPCQSLIGEQQTECLRTAGENLKYLWDEYRTSYDNPRWVDTLERQVDNLISGNTDNSGEIAFNSFLGSTVQTSIKTFFISLQFAFQNLLESAMLLVAVLGPLAVGGSLLPVAGKPIFAWLTGFLSVAIAKISFNIIAIVTATVIVNSVNEPAQYVDAIPDLTWFIIFLGLLAPLLSLALAAAGGFAVFNAIANTASWVRARV